MSQIILDLSANTHKNDCNYLRRMIDEIYKIDTKKHEIVFKAQLFEKAGDNIPLLHDVFDYMYKYATSYGYKVTSSVFDLPSLKFLLKYNIPFVKIANNRALDWLIGEVPRKIPVYVSVGEQSDEYDDFKRRLFRCDIIYITEMCCVSEYPTVLSEYEEFFGKYSLENAISDHTINWDLFNKYKPFFYECHYKLDDSTGLDAGDFARTPSQLSAIL